jgi:hypothetical protein
VNHPKKIQFFAAGRQKPLPIHEAENEQSDVTDPQKKAVEEGHFSQEASVMQDSYQDEPEDPDHEEVGAGRMSRPSKMLLSNLSDL